MAEKLTPLKAIRLHCLECMGWNPEDPDSIRPEKAVRHCSAIKCRMHPFRMGKDPNRKGKGGNKYAHRLWKRNLNGPLIDNSKNQ